MKTQKIRNNIFDEEWWDCLARLREARALVLRDAEAFHEAAMTLERIGQIVCGQIGKGLGDYRDAIVDLIEPGDTPEADSVKRLFDTVKDARNMAVHEGAWARHLSSRLVELLILLEQSIGNRMKYAEDIMVRQPVVAEKWHMVTHVRQMMLANSFSTLPVDVDGRWHLITDWMIMRFLRDAGTKADREARLSASLESVIRSGRIEPGRAKCFPGKTPVSELATEMGQEPVLITEGKETPPRLLGILSPFDLL